jgi:hypothetical protein
MGDTRRLIDRVLDPAFTEALTARRIEELRSMRDSAKEAETELSFERRLCQARIDILTAELENRSGGRDTDLMERLPEILAGQRPPSSGPLPARAPDLSVPRNADVPRRRVEEIAGERTLARLTQLSDEEIKGVVSALAEYEREISERRKRIHEVIDTIQAEIVRRYVSGEADPSAALS